MMNDVDQLVRSPYAAGIAGSLVALKFTPGASLGERIFNVLAGSLVAVFVSPAVAEWLAFTSHGLISGLAFVLGLFGLSLAAAATQAIRETPLGQLIGGLLSRKG